MPDIDQWRTFCQLVLLDHDPKQKEAECACAEYVSEEQKQERKSLKKKTKN